MNPRPFREACRPESSGIVPPFSSGGVRNSKSCDSAKGRREGWASVCARASSRASSRSRSLREKRSRGQGNEEDGVGVASRLRTRARARTREHEREGRPMWWWWSTLVGIALAASAFAACRLLRDATHRTYLRILVRRWFRERRRRRRVPAPVRDRGGRAPETEFSSDEEEAPGTP